MNYLLDKKVKKDRPIKIAGGVIALIILFFFHASIFNGLSYVSAKVFHPVLSTGNSIGRQVKNLSGYFSSKKSLYNENLNLKARIDADVAYRANYDSIVKENSDLKEILGRKSEWEALTVAAILEKPNQSPYDTLVIDIGSDDGVRVGNIVFALGNIPIGRVAEVHDDTSKVILFSTSGEKTQTIISSKNVSAELVGRGGGNFEMVLPRDMVLLKDDQVVLPGITPYVVGIVKSILSDQREAFQKALLVSPVNIQSLKFVEVQK